MSRPAGRCVFCGGSGLTKGHVLPDWLGKVLPRADGHAQFSGPELFETFKPKPAATPERKDHQGDATTRRLRNTCLKCNGGWMSQIEDFSQHWAIPLILGRPLLLETCGQFALSALASLIAMRIEFMGPKRTITQEDRDLLRFSRTLSDKWLVWIAPYRDQKPSKWVYQHYAIQLSPMPESRPSPDFYDAHICTVVLGKLCLHSIYSHIRLAGYGGMAQIWPPISPYIDFGRAKPLTSNGVVLTHEALGRNATLKLRQNTD